MLVTPMLLEERMYSCLLPNECLLMELFDLLELTPVNKSACAQRSGAAYCNGISRPKQETAEGTEFFLHHECVFVARLFCTFRRSIHCGGLSFPSDLWVHFACLQTFHEIPEARQ